MTDSPLGLPARPTSKSDAAPDFESEIRKADLKRLMEMAGEMADNLQGKGVNTGVPDVASGGSYL